MSLPVAKPRFTIQEYLDKEHVALDKHEYHAGEILMMAGGNYRHSQVITGALLALGSRLRGKSCQVTESNTRVAIASRSTYVYPDITVVCGEPEFDPLDQRRTTIINPTLVVEVLSEGTAAYDRAEKFDLYLDIKSLREYVLISVNEPKVEAYFRQQDGTWAFAFAKGLDSIIAMRSIGMDIPLSEIFERVTFEPRPH